MGEICNERKSILIEIEEKEADIALRDKKNQAVSYTYSNNSCLTSLNSTTMRTNQPEMYQHA